MRDIEILQNLDDDVVLALIYQQKSESVIVNLKYFNIHDYKHIILALSLKSLCLLSERRMRACNTQFNKEVAFHLIENGGIIGVRTVVACFDLFYNFDKHQLLKALIHNDKWDVIRDNLTKPNIFHDISHNYIVRQLLDARKYNSIATGCNDKTLSKLSARIAQRIIKESPIDIIDDKNIMCFLISDHKKIRDMLQKKKQQH